ncbi:MAG: hypothetical protein CML02_19780 [Pseudooceanicola sp.]|nr:hypothetical protein [Pseudooceanicola sp.]
MNGRNARMAIENSLDLVPAHDIDFEEKLLSVLLIQLSRDFLYSRVIGGCGGEDEPVERRVK